MNIGTCATCAFFYSEEDDTRTTCRAKPPQLAFASGRGTVSHWPSVASSHWCGEYYDGIVDGVRKTYSQMVQDGDTTPHTWSLRFRQKAASSPNTGLMQEEDENDKTRKPNRTSRSAGE